ncbi:clarin-1 [Seriola lalandi dorsalis]|uniref:Clarin 1 n=1 Tax=Seriola lalandi dorsalis TaxID=1841481 RepID=A0A3B4X4P7_SERLL|nr:clarin-1 [Seriola lalandi dorsalis]XP_056229636.1 clarin-1 [Seriola aureovittata]
MPTRQKQLIFSLCGVFGFSCALTAAVATGLPFWLNGTVLCRTGADLVNATGPELDKFLGDLSYGLFHGQRVKQCGLGGRPSRFSLFTDLLSAIPAGIHITVIFFCCVVILFSSVASGFFFFNAFGRPYETLQGPMGLYLWTFICCLCSFLVMILFASEVKLHHLSDRIANFNEDNFVYQTYSESYDQSFWLFFLIFLLHGLNILLIRLAGFQFPFQETKELDLSGGAADLMY